MSCSLLAAHPESRVCSRFLPVKGSFSLPVPPSAYSRWDLLGLWIRSQRKRSRPALHKKCNENFLHPVMQIDQHNACQRSVFLVSGKTAARMWILLQWSYQRTEWWIRPRGTERKWAESKTRTGHIFTRSVSLFCHQNHLNSEIT